MTDPVTYTVEEAAVLLRISRNSAYGAVRAGDIPSIRLGRRLLIPRARFHAWLGAVEHDDHTEGVA